METNTPTAISMTAIDLRIIPPILPGIQQVLDRILKDRGIELVPNELPISFGEYQLCVAQDAQMPGDGRPARGKVLGDLPRAHRTAPEQTQDIASRRIGERTKDGIHSHG
jgi:hypothetical protein